MQLCRSGTKTQGVWMMLKRNGVMCMVILAMVASVGLAGCSDVALRPGLPDYMSNLSIPVFQNRTAQPEIENEITQEVNQGFLVDGRMELTDSDKANAILEGTIIQYLLEPLLLDVHNTPQQYKMRIILRLSLKDTKAGQSLWSEDAFEESTTYYVANNLSITPEDEQTARRRLVKQLSQRIVSKVIEGF
jgi:Lipopolysaccharide-assembly